MQKPTPLNRIGTERHGRRLGRDHLVRHLHGTELSRYLLAWLISAPCP